MLALRRNTAHPALFRWRCDARRPPHLSVQRFSRHPLRSPTRLPLTNSYIFRSNFSTKLQVCSIGRNKEYLPCLVCVKIQNLIYVPDIVCIKHRLFCSTRIHLTDKHIII